MKRPIQGPATGLGAGTWGVLAAGVCGLFLVGCVVAPPPLRDTRPSYDGMEANSGFLGWTGDGHGRLTPRALDRYNALLDRYGGQLVPPVGRDSGITRTNGEIWIDREGLVRFQTLNRWQKEKQP